MVMLGGAIKSAQTVALEDKITDVVAKEGLAITADPDCTLQVRNRLVPVGVATSGVAMPSVTSMLPTGGEVVPLPVTQLVSVY